MTIRFLLMGLSFLATCQAFRLDPAQGMAEFSGPVAHLVQDEDHTPLRRIQELVRTDHQLLQELVIAQPHLVHDIGRPEIHETSRSQPGMEASNSSESQQPTSSVDQEEARPRSTVEDEDVMENMERMVHLGSVQEPGNHQGPADSANPEMELHAGPGAGDSSLEASGFYGMDAEDRTDEREERERRWGEERGEDEWERTRVVERRRDRDKRRGTGHSGEHRDVRLWKNLAEMNHTAPDLDTLIGYSPSLILTSSSRPGQSRLTSPSPVHHAGPQKHQEAPMVELKREDMWEREEEGQTSGMIHPFVDTTTATTTTSGGYVQGTVTMETETGTDFGVVVEQGQNHAYTEVGEDEEEDDIRLTHLDAFTHNPTVAEVGIAPSREPLQPSMEELEHEVDKYKKEVERTRTRPFFPLNTDPTPTVAFTDLSWGWLGQALPPHTERSEVRAGGFTEIILPGGEMDDMLNTQQVVCVDWSELTGRGYVILNISENMNCEEFREERGVRLLEVLERRFARRMNSPEGSWVIYLSKPTHQQHQLLMNVASEHGVIATKDVLGMLGEIRRSLDEVGVQNYSAASSCQSRPSQTRSDYGKLFVVLVIIGSVCMVIITSGLIYICWQKRLPTTKTMSRAEELHFVENGCHDNPTLDVANDSQPEMAHKKPSTNGLAVGGERGGEDSSRWQVFVNQAGCVDEEEEQDTHL